MIIKHDLEGEVSFPTHHSEKAERHTLIKLVMQHFSFLK